MSGLHKICNVCSEEIFTTNIFKTNICIVESCQSRDAIYSVYEYLYKNFVNKLIRSTDFEILLKEYQVNKEKLLKALTTPASKSKSGLFLDHLNSYEKLLKHVLENSETPLYRKINTSIIWNESVLRFINSISQLNTYLDEEKERLLNLFIHIDAKNKLNKKKRISKTLYTEPRDESKHQDILEKKSQKLDSLTLQKVDAIYIFDLDNTLRLQVDNTLIEHNVRILNNILNDSKKNNLVYIASCNSTRNVNDWVEQNGYKEKVFTFASVCAKGYKDFSNIVNTFKDFQVTPTTNKFVIGDTFQDMDAIRHLRKNQDFSEHFKNWFFIRSYLKSNKLVENYLSENSGLFRYHINDSGIPNHRDDYTIYPFDEDEKFYNYDCGDLYYLPDAVSLPNQKNYGVLTAEFNQLSKIEEFKNSKELYIQATYGENTDEEYLNSTGSLGFGRFMRGRRYCDESIDKIDNIFEHQFNIAILGRYFRQRVHEQLAASDVASEIIKFKNTNELSKNLTSCLDKFFINQIFDMNNETDKRFSNIIFCSIPNSSGDYRFNNYLDHLSEILKSQNEKYKLNILFEIKKTFIKQTGNKSPNHNLKGIEARIENVKDKYELNLNYFLQKKEKTLIYVIDDVLTSGSHFNEIFRLIKNSGFIYYQGVVLGKHQSYPYTDSRGLINYNYAPLNLWADSLYLDWSDLGYFFNHPEV